MSISLTAFGYIFVPLTLGVVFLRPDYLLPLLIVSSAFQAAAVVNVSVGSFFGGVQPFYFVAGFIALRLVSMAMKTHALLPPRGSAARKISRSLLQFWGWACASAFLLPVIFRGTFVLVPRKGVPEVSEIFWSDMYGEPLVWSLSNLAQALFLTLSALVILYALRIAKPSLARRAVLSLKLAVGIVVGVGILQLIALKLGLRFPYSIINSNPAWAKLYDERLSGIIRLSTTFSEPSDAGGFLAAAWIGLLAEFCLESRSLGLIGAQICTFLIMLRTTASTAYATAAIGVILLVLYFWHFSKKIGGEKTWGGFLLCVVLYFLVGLGAYIFSGKLFEAMQAATVEKFSSGSFVSRSLANVFSMHLVFQTYGMGVGLGSNRPTSLITYILSNLGVAGFLLFGFFVGRMLYALWTLSRRLEKKTNSQFLFWMTVGWLLAQSLSLPNLTSAELWAIFATGASVIGAQRLRFSRVAVGAGQTSSGMPE